MPSCNASIWAHTEDETNLRPTFAHEKSIQEFLYFRSNFPVWFLAAISLRNFLIFKWLLVVGSLRGYTPAKTKHRRSATNYTASWPFRKYSRETSRSTASRVAQWACFDVMWFDRTEEGKKQKEKELLWERFYISYNSFQSLNLNLGHWTIFEQLITGLRHIQNAELLKSTTQNQVWNGVVYSVSLFLTPPDPLSCFQNFIHLNRRHLRTA